MCRSVKSYKTGTLCEIVSSRSVLSSFTDNIHYVKLLVGKMSNFELVFGFTIVVCVVQKLGVRQKKSMWSRI